MLKLLEADDQLCRAFGEWCEEACWLDSGELRGDERELRLASDIAPFAVLEVGDDDLAGGLGTVECDLRREHFERLGACGEGGKCESECGEDCDEEARRAQLDGARQTAASGPVGHKATPLREWRDWISGGNDKLSQLHQSEFMSATDALQDKTTLGGAHTASVRDIGIA